MPTIEEMEKEIQRLSKSKTRLSTLQGVRGVMRIIMDPSRVAAGGKGYGVRNGIHIVANTEFRGLVERDHVGCDLNPVQRSLVLSFIEQEIEGLERDIERRERNPLGGVPEKKEMTTDEIVYINDMFAFNSDHDAGVSVAGLAMGEDDQGRDVPGRMMHLVEGLGEEKHIEYRSVTLAPAKPKDGFGEVTSFLWSQCPSCHHWNQHQLSTSGRAEEVTFVCPGCGHTWKPGAKS